MKTFKLTKDLTFEAKAFKNTTSWGHEITAFYKDRELVSKKTYYINRTLERYTYEMALLSMIHTLDSNFKSIVPLGDRLQGYKFIKEYI